MMMPIAAIHKYKFHLSTQSHDNNISIIDLCDSRFSEAFFLPTNRFPFAST